MNTTSSTLALALSRLELHDSCRSRARLDAAKVKEYADLLKAGVQFPNVVAYLPPVIAYHDGARYLLADGWLRYHAHKQAGHSHIMVDVRPGGLREARLFAASANALHGLPRTLEDKRRAVLLVLEDEGARGWSAARIAGHCGGMSPPFVSAIRKAWEDLQKLEKEQAEARGKQLLQASARKVEEGEAGNALELVGATLDPDDDLDGEDDVTHDQEVTRERWLRAFRKLERFSELLGSTTEVLIAEYRAEQAELVLASAKK